MNNIKKHTDIVNSIEEFESNLNNGVYVEPWVVYINNGDGTYSIKYSNDINRTHSSISPDIVSGIQNRIKQLEEENVFCFENEYETLLANGEAWVTDVDGSKKYEIFDNKKIYYIYEDEGPENTDIFVFTLNDITCKAVSGITWEEWINENKDIRLFIHSDNTIHLLEEKEGFNSQILLTSSGRTVFKTDEINEPIYLFVWDTNEPNTPENETSGD